MPNDLTSRRPRYVTTPDGRMFFGQPPEALNGRTGEAPYIAALAQQIDGLTEVNLRFGRADAATSTDVFEVEPVRSWKHGVRQVFGYAGMSGLAPNLALFGQADYLPIYLKLQGVPDLTLWRWTGYRFKRILSERAAHWRDLSMDRSPDPIKVTYADA